MPDFSDRHVQEKHNRYSKKNMPQISAECIRYRDNQEDIHQQIGGKIIRTTNPSYVRLGESFDKEPKTT
jgi:hypothetical protein